METMKMTNYRCSLCNASYPIEETRWKCDCGGLLDLEKTTSASSDHWTEHASIWRYATR
jgi:threonine synthase